MIKPMKTKRLLAFLAALSLAVLVSAWLGFFDIFVPSPYGPVSVLDTPPWGISKEELLKSKKNRHYDHFDYNGRDCYMYEETVMNRTASVSYIFSDKKLDNIQIIFSNGQWSRKEWDDFMRDIKKHLIATVGSRYVCDYCASNTSKEAECYMRFRKGTTYGVLRSKTPDGYHSGTWFDLYDGQSPIAKQRAMTMVCRLMDAGECWPFKADNICEK